MRSSKSRSRSKANRPRPLGNIVNRVFDSSGPEGKVRGTPQQIIDKYLLLARDAQLSNDRVAAENFLQHAEHYTRMLTEAQRESAREAETRRQSGDPQGQNANHGQGQGRPRYEDRDGRRHDPAQGDAGSAYGDTQPQPDDAPAEQVARDPAPVQPAEPDTDHGLVETPEGSASPPAAPGRRRRAPQAAPAPEGAAADGEAKPAPKRRAPRRPRAAGGEAGAKPSDPKTSAAE